MKIFQPPNYMNARRVKTHDTIHTIRMPGGPPLYVLLGVFFLVRPLCGIVYYRRFFRTVRLRDLQEKSLLLSKRPATHLQFPWCCSCSWAAVVTYHQVSRMLVCPLFNKKKSNVSSKNTKYKKSKNAFFYIV